MAYILKVPSYDGDKVCDDVIAKAIENTKTILKPNLKSILLALNDKMAKDSIVVFNGYAQFFNTDDEATCVEKQNWGFIRLLPKHWRSGKIELTVARRKQFNSLVVGINDAIKDVINDVKGNVKYRLGFSDWDRWAYQGVRGQFCDPQGSGDYPDKQLPDLQFFKRDTTPYKDRTYLPDPRIVHYAPEHWAGTNIRCRGISQLDLHEKRCS